MPAFDRLCTHGAALALTLAFGQLGCDAKATEARPEHALGAFLHGPSAISWRDGRVELFVVGAARGVWRSACGVPPCDRRDRFENWLSDAGAPPSGAGSRVSATAWGDRRHDLFVVGADDRRLWHQTRQGATWLGWEDMSGALFSAPFATSWGDGRLDVFAVGPGETIYQRYCDGTAWLACRASAWTPWGPYPGRPPAGIVGDPAAIAPALYQIEVAVLGRDGAVWYAGFLNGWGAWQSLGGNFAHAPAIASVAHRTEIYAMDANKVVHRAVGSARTFGAFVALDVKLDEAPTAAGTTSSAELFARTARGETLAHLSCSEAAGCAAR